MAKWSISPPLPLLGLLSLLLLLHRPSPSAAIRVNIIQKPSPSNIPAFHEAPAFRNGDSCTRNSNDDNNNNNDRPVINRKISDIHIVMPIDVNYLRGTMAAILSILKHSTCPENVSFHFLSVHLEHDIDALIKSVFPFLKYTMHHFDARRVKGKIAKSIRQALDQPLNYARIYMPDILPEFVQRVIYLDSDTIVVDDIRKLWEVELGDNVLAAPEYCHANFRDYFTEAFWGDEGLAATFRGRSTCYFNTGVMVVDVEKWREGGYTEKVEEWMVMQKQRRIYQLGSLPPILLVFAGT